MTYGSWVFLDDTSYLRGFVRDPFKCYEVIGVVLAYASSLLEECEMNLNTNSWERNFKSSLAFQVRLSTLQRK
jgi:hypothetical protein